MTPTTVNGTSGARDPNPEKTGTRDSNIGRSNII
jgi:hypothetical protein